MKRALERLGCFFRWKPSVWALLISLSSAVAVSNAFARSSDDNKLVFIGNKNIAPVVYLEEGRETGVAVDLVKALATRMSKPVEIKAMDWQEAQALVARGEADALIQINQTEERKKTYDFSDPFLESYFTVFVHSGRVGISGISSLHGLRVGVESAGLPRQVLEKDRAIQLITIPNFIEGFNWLNEAALDAVVVDYRVGSYIIAKNRIRNIKVTGKPIASSYSSIAVKKGNITLLNEINNALRSIKGDGTYQRILDEWGPTEVIFQTKEEIQKSTYNMIIFALIVLFSIAAIWTMTLRAQLEKRKAAELSTREQYSTLLSIINSANAYIFAVDKQYRYMCFNQGYADTLKRLYNTDIELGHSLFEYMTLPEDHEPTKRNLDRALSGEHVIEETYSGEGPRSRRYFQVSISPVVTEKEGIIGATVLVQDQTERKLAEEALHRVNRELQAISNCGQTLMRAKDEQSLIDDVCRIICDEAGYRMAWLGYPENNDAKTLRPAAWAGVEEGYLGLARISWADTERGRGPVGTAIRTGATAFIQDFLIDSNGAPWRELASERGYRSCISLPLKEGTADPFAVLTIYSTEPNAFTQEEIRLLEELAGDLAFGIVALRTRAERKWMEESLAKREQEFRTLTENSPDVIVRYDREGRRIYVNPTFEKVNHLSSKEVLGTRPTELSTELTPMAAFFSRRLKESMDTGDAAQIDLQWIKDGKENCWFVRVIPERNASGEVVSALTIWTDISDRKRLETAMRESEQKFRSLAENSPDNIIRYDKHCRVIYANHQINAALNGPGESFLGLTPLERFPNGLYDGGEAEMERYQAELERVIASGDAADVDLHVLDGAGSLRIHSIRFAAERDQEGRIVGALAFGRDTTEKAKLEEQLRQSQKMEAIGKLAGGVAHDFNNILTAIIGFANLAKMKMAPGDPQQGFIDHILTASDRAAHLTQSLLAFSRKQLIIPKPVDLNAIVRSVEKLLRRLIGEDIDLSTRLAEKSLIVMADAGQIEQVLMNLATNARDAMPEGGAFTISTELKTLGEDFTSAHGYLKPGSYALIIVSDTGVGMEESTRERVFEPFFTTKEQGKGTGLGLSMVYGTVEQHEGHISVYSEPGKGTTFRILLPVIDSDVEESPNPMDEQPPRGTETLLLAEDDPAVRVLAATVLKGFGYRVIEAVDGKDALEKYAERHEDIDLLILDVIMPKMGGKEVCDAVKAMHPEARILFISGYTADALQKKGIFGGDVQFIAKPMSPFELLKKVRGILDGKG